MQPSKRCTVLVSGLPSRGDSNRITGMLGVMSDNCGGKVLFVDLPTGMARITYKSYESALKWVFLFPISPYKLLF